MKKKIKLKRELGLFEVVLCGIGIIVGAGIYTLIGKSVMLGGNGTWISFIIAGVVACFSGLSYAELSSMMPKSGAEYDYTKKAFGRPLAFVIGWLIIVGGLFAVSVVALGFAGYFSAIIELPIIPVAICLILVISYIVYAGIGQSAKIAIFFTIMEVTGLFIIIFIGLPHIGSVDYFDIPSLDGIFAAAALIFFAFIGFEDIVRLAEETKSPRKNIPRAIVIAILSTMILYVLVALSSISVLDWQTLGASNAPMADIVSTAFGGNAVLIISIIALLSTFNTALLILLATSRIMYGMANSGSLPKIFSRIHPKTRTPYNTIFMLMIFSILFLFIGGINVIANVSNFSIFFIFIIINLSLIVLRFKQPEIKKRFKTPINIGRFPVLSGLGAISCMFMIMNLGIRPICLGFALLVVGFFVYIATNIKIRKKISQASINIKKVF